MFQGNFLIDDKVAGARPAIFKICWILTILFVKGKEVEK
jgi:hypothetical protein